MSSAKNGTHQTLSFVPSATLITKYSKPGPRYTSYPPVPYWPEGYGAGDYDRALGEMGERIKEGRTSGNEPTASIYVHVPFCEHRCTFCACNVIISRAHERGDVYVSRVIREMDRVLKGIGAARPKVRQIHWGGGTPTWLSPEELAKLQDAIAERFDLTPDREQSIEVDPRVTTPEQLATLRERGLNRVSMGVQDLDDKVQQAIHRIQPAEMAGKIIKTARSLGIDGINADLVYGLPYQTPAGFAETIDTIVGLGVDRVALYNFAHLPDKLRHHRAIRTEWLPSAETRVELFRTAADRFARAGYVMIGLDHFAKGTDELARAFTDGTMQRNFMGYTTRAGSDLLAFGVSSISRVGRDFIQSVKVTEEYERFVDADVPPIERGLRMSDDDLLREDVIQSLMCYSRVKFDRLGEAGRTLLRQTGVSQQLDDLAKDGLIEWNESELKVTEMGRYFLRNIAMTFDAYLGRSPNVKPDAQDRLVQVRFSTTV